MLCLIYWLIILFCFNFYGKAYDLFKNRNKFEMSASIVKVILSIFKQMHYHILNKIVCVMTRDVPKCLLKLMYLIKQYTCFG